MFSEAGGEPETSGLPRPRRNEAPRAVPLRPPVLYCGKCLKRCADGKTLRRALKEAVKAHAADGAERGSKGGGKSGSRRKVRLVESGCLGLCPKGALVLASAATLARGEAVLLRGVAEVEAALPRLLPEEPGARGV